MKTDKKSNGFISSSTAKAKGRSAYYKLLDEAKEVSRYKVNVYNIERFVCDVITFRNKIGMDICSEVVNCYLSMPDRNLTRLM